MKTDRELLELAAKSIGLAQPWSERAQAYRWAEGSDWIEWNPLTNNGDAFTTMVKLGLLVSVRQGSDRMKALIEVVVPHPLADISLPFAGDGVDATRRAIVMAAAAIGETAWRSWHDTYGVGYWDTFDEAELNCAEDAVPEPLFTKEQL